MIEKIDALKETKMGKILIWMFEEKDFTFEMSFEFS